MTIPLEERDPALGEKLASEGSGILAWMMAGCHDWQHVRLTPPPRVRNATDSYFEKEDIFSQWLAECCKTGSDYHRAGSTALYKSWKGWAAASGEQAISQKRFAQMLEGKGFKSVKAHGVMEFVGVTLAVEPSKHEPEHDRF